MDRAGDILKDFESRPLLYRLARFGLTATATLALTLTIYYSAFSPPAKNSGVRVLYAEKGVGADSENAGYPNATPPPTKDTLYINEAGVRQMLKVGFDASDVARIMLYREAGGVYKDLPHLRRSGIDTLKLVSRESQISFRETSRAYSLSPKTDRHKRSGKRVGLYYASPKELAELGVPKDVVEAINSLKKKYIVRGSTTVDTLLALTPQNIETLLASHLTPKSVAFKDGRPPQTATAKAPVELNSANAERLTSVRGIAAKRAGYITERRERLGGFVDVRQLLEVFSIDSVAFGLIAPQVTVDTSAVRKLNLNTADPKALSSHPYISRNIYREIMDRRREGQTITPHIMKKILGKYSHSEHILRYVEY